MRSSMDRLRSSTLWLPLEGKLSAELTDEVVLRFDACFVLFVLYVEISFSLRFTTQAIQPRHIRRLSRHKRRKRRRETAKGFPDSSLCQGAKPLWKPRAHSAQAVALNLIMLCERDIGGKVIAKKAAFFALARDKIHQGGKVEDFSRGTPAFLDGSPAFLDALASPRGEAVSGAD